MIIGYLDPWDYFLVALTSRSSLFLDYRGKQVEACTSKGFLFT